MRDAAGTGTDLIELSRKVTLPDHTASNFEIRTAGIILQAPTNIEPEYFARIIKALETR